MAAQILDGKRVADEIKAQVGREVEELVRQGGRRPRLTVVLVGEDPASQVYVKSKAKASAGLGIESETVKLPATVPEGALIEEIQRLNRDDGVDGILVQLPLPKGFHTDRVLETMAIEKDVDGFHPVNVGRLLLGQPCLAPCTPAGIIELLVRNGIEIAGKRACVVGRSRIVGKPVASLLLNRHATVTICHSKTPDLPSVTRTADILIAAIGKSGFVTGGMVRPGAVVVDVGIGEISRQEELTRFFDGADLEKRRVEVATKGRTLVGDVEWKSVLAVAGAITPVPGGVGPLTIAMLMRNVLDARKARGS